MAMYTSGSVTIYVGSTAVVGNGTAFNTYVSTGDLFKLRSESAFYDVATVNSATRLTLSASYANSTYSTGATLAAMPYQVVTDFTPNYSFPEIGINDTNFQHIYTKAMRMVDSSLDNVDKVVSKTTNYTVAENNLVIFASNTISITVASATKKWRTSICNNGSGVITATSPGSDTIEGNVSIRLTKQYDTVSLVGDGTSTHTEIF